MSPECATSEAAALAQLDPRSGTATHATARFSVSDGVVTLSIEVTDATPGQHAVHLHLNGDCSADDASSAGPHWNPEDHAHGQLGHGAAHKGDIGNVTVGSDGRGSLVFSTSEWSVGTGAPNDVLGHAVVLHAAEDDFTSQPAGNAGGRIACGVVQPVAAAR